jgi:hypothetical protein
MSDGSPSARSDVLTLLTMLEVLAQDNNPHGITDTQTLIAWLFEGHPSTVAEYRRIRNTYLTSGIPNREPVTRERLVNAISPIVHAAKSYGEAPTHETCGRCVTTSHLIVDAIAPLVGRWIEDHEPDEDDRPSVDDDLLEEQWVKEMVR